MLVWKMGRVGMWRLVVDAELASVSRQPEERR